MCLIRSIILIISGRLGVSGSHFMNYTNKIGNTLKSNIKAEWLTRKMLCVRSDAKRQTSHLKTTSPRWKVWLRTQLHKFTHLNVVGFRFVFTHSCIAEKRKQIFRTPGCFTCSTSAAKRILAPQRHQQETVDSLLVHSLYTKPVN